VNVLIKRDLARRAAPLACGLLGALLGAYVVASPSAGKLLTLAVYGVVLVAVALALPPHVFLPAALLFAGVSTAFGSTVVSIGPAALYASDLAVLVIFLRGALPRARHPGLRALAGLPQALFVVWMFIMTVAGIHAMLAGVPTASVIRGDLALFYWPLLYFGFTRVLAEVDIDISLLWRNLALVAVGFAAYMFIARALNHPFHDPGLALVPTGQSEAVPRNFGFAAAFSIYPVLALAAVAGMANSRDHRFRWTALASIGVIATLTTLVRGEIFSLGLGILLVLWLSPRSNSQSGRTRTAVNLALASAVTVFAVLAVDPKLGHAVIQRSLPFTHQAEAATANADYRFAAMGTGIRVARAHPAGLGVLDVQGLVQHDIDPGYIAHSGFATLLIAGGWLALGAAVLTILSVIHRSFHAATASKWLHPAFVGAIAMLCAYTLGAGGLAGDPWVVPLGALLVALRFGLQSNTR
jgi:hypothetical protein